MFAEKKGKKAGRWIFFFFLCVLCLGQVVTSAVTGRICPKCLCSQQMVLHWWPRAREVSRTAPRSSTIPSPALCEKQLEVQSLLKERDLEDAGSRHCAVWKWPVYTNAVQSEFPLVVFPYVCVNL